MAGIKAFREPYLVADLENDSQFSDINARRFRYSLYWAFFENSAYRSIHTWSQKYKIDYGLYRYIRNIYNPAYRLGEFWRTFLMGGTLDPDAGSGEKVPSCLPIKTDNEALRPAIAKLWRWSNWQLQKDIMTLYGPVLGDVAIKVIDDTARQKVYLEVVHPMTLSEIDLDSFGNVKAYRIDEIREDPRSNNHKTVTYTEIADRIGGDLVRYRTYLDGSPYAWNGSSDEWNVDYGFIPMVTIQHVNVGLSWGWSELHAARTKIQEVDDLASKFHDQIRKTVDAPWLFAGVDKGSLLKKTTETAATSDQPAPGREEIPALWGPVGSDVKPLIAPLDLGAVGGEIASSLKELERDYPELQMDIWTVQGDPSGRALRIARQRPESKVNQRRGAYDDGMVRLHQMAVAIGGHREYGPEFASFSLESYAEGALDHSIGKRSVFAVDPMDDIELDQAFWNVVKSAVDSGMPLITYLREESGWDEEKIGRLVADPEFQSKVANLEASAAATRQAIEMSNRIGAMAGQPFSGGGGSANEEPAQ